MKSLKDTINETILSRKLSDPKDIIYQWLDKYGVENYTINSKGEIDVDGDVNLYKKNIKEFPEYIQFGTIKGIFDCRFNKLTSLRGCPKEVGRDFYCSDNQLTSLEGAPEKVGRNFNCNDNELTSLEGAPEEVGRNFNCNDNELTSLEGAPKEVGKDFYCCYNKLIFLKGAPKEVGGNFDCIYNTTKFTFDDVRKVSNVKVGIAV